MADESINWLKYLLDKTAEVQIAKYQGSTSYQQPPAVEAPESITKQGNGDTRAQVNWLLWGGVAVATLVGLKVAKVI